MKNRIRIGIAHRFQLFCDSLEETLKSQPRMQVTSITRNSQETIQAVRNQRVDVLLLDPFFEDKNGLDLVSELLKIQSNLHLIVLMLEVRYDYANKLLETGVHGLISPDCGTKELTHTIYSVSAGRKVLPPLFNHQMLEYLEKLGTRALTPREMQVLTLIGEGKSKQEIAQTLYIASKTVDTHRANLKEKLALRNNMEMVLYAVRHGYVRA